MSNKNQNTSPFLRLQEVIYKFSIEDLGKKISILKECSLIKITNPKIFRNYHNNLLFILSYSQDEIQYELALSEMKRITLGINDKQKEQLAETGIGKTPTRGAYSLTLIAWLLENYPGTLSLHSFDDDGVHPREVLESTLSEAEFEITSDESLSSIKWIEKASGSKDKKQNLAWLISAFDLIEASSAIKDKLFESLDVYVEINPNENLFSRSFGKINIEKHFFHNDGILKKFDEQELIRKKLPVEIKLSNSEKERIIAASRIAICLLNRETDPITYCKEKNLKYYELERGLSIALFCIDTERRLSLESYVGFMMFKNGYPMSYGGAWLFGKRSLIGINIFEAFRGGESAFVFAQLLRCYRMAFGATYFEVEPYQFGKHNPEGIKSGAFWFYYRFGFRPIDKRLLDLSESEAKKIISQKGYRSSSDVLRDFTKSNLCAHFASEIKTPVNPSDLSKWVTQRINTEFKGNRKQTFSWAIKKLKSEKILNGKEKAVGLKKLAIFFAMCINYEKLNLTDRKNLQKLIVLKTDSEFEYINLIHKISFENFNIKHGKTA